LWTQKETVSFHKMYVYNTQGNPCQLVAILFKDSPLWSQPYLQELNIWIKRTCRVAQECYWRMCMLKSVPCYLCHISCSVWSIFNPTFKIPENFHVSEMLPTAELEMWVQYAYSVTFHWVNKSGDNEPKKSVIYLSGRDNVGRSIDCCYWILLWCQ